MGLLFYKVLITITKWQNFSQNSSYVGDVYVLVSKEFLKILMYSMIPFVWQSHSAEDGLIWFCLWNRSFYADTDIFL